MKKIFPLLFSMISFQIINAQITPQWVSRYNGVGDYSDKFNAIQVDNSGNVYLAGYSVKYTENRDFVTVKCNALGDTLWARTMDGSGNNDDEVLAMAIDGSGNVYVTGYADGVGTGNDFLTIKYNSIGDTVWTRVYNFTANQDDQPNAIAVDGNGNVYVTGQSDNDPSSLNTNDDYVTIKYDANGNVQWITRYNGAGNGTDRAISLALDASANVYVTGRSLNVFLDDDYMTIKYTSSGTQVWAVGFDGGQGNDRASALKLDASGNIYVTGRSNNGNDDDYLTIKYDNNGNELWQGGISYNGTGQNNDRATALTLDALGNVFVTGRSDRDPSSVTNYDFATIKYDQTGAQLWVTIFNGTANNNDVPTAISVSQAGNVYVTGSIDSDPSTLVNNDYETIMYSSVGVLQWQHTYAGTANGSDVANAMFVDASGNVFVTGGGQNLITQKDGVTIKYDVSGSQQWLKIFNGLGDNYDNVNASVTDAAGFTYTAGYSYELGQDRDYCTIKISPIGDTVWVKKFNGTSNSTDEATAIAIDQSGNVYVTGFAKDTSSSYDFVTIKYNGSGVQQWLSTYNNTLANGSDKATGICIDPSGNVFVIGQSDADASSNVNYDWAVLKYNSTGGMAWATTINGTGNGNDIPVAIATTTTGNIVVTGTNDVDATIFKNDNCFTMELGPTANTIWTASFNGTANGNDQPNAMYVDAAGNVYVTGQSDRDVDTAVTNYDYMTIKYNSTGVQQWASFYNGTGDGTDRSNAITTLYGSVYVTGQTDTDPNVINKSYDYMTIKYDANGVQQWATPYNGTGSLDDIATAIAVDNTTGFVYVTGQSNSGTLLSPNNDIATIQYNNLGVQQLTAIYDGPVSNSDNPVSICIQNNSIFVSGGSWGSTGEKDAITIRYNGFNVGIQENKNELAASAFPNPFSDHVSIAIEFTKAEHVSIQLMDIYGQELKLILSGTISTSEGDHIYELNTEELNLSNGIYFVKITSENINRTIKIVSEK